MAYRADIEIGVRGAERLKELQDRITRLGRAIDDANVKTLIDRSAVQSINSYGDAVARATRNLRETAIQLDAAGKASGNYAQAISQVVTALGQENAAQKIQNDLIRDEIELRRRAKLGAAGIREGTQYGGPIGPGAASPVALRSRVEGRIKSILDERKGRAELNAVLEDQFERERRLYNSKLDQKAARVQQELDKQAAAAAESALQIEKLTARQQEFTNRTDTAAQAAARQTVAFYRQARIAKEVAKINAAAGPAQLLLAPATPGSPAMSGGARRRITGQTERLGGARTADEAAATLRLAAATNQLVESTKKIDPKYNRFLPDTATLDATNRGIQRLTTNQEAFNQQVQSGIRYEQKYNQELERRRRLGIGVQATNRMPGTSSMFTGPFPVSGPIDLRGGFNQTMLPGSQFAARQRMGAGIRGRLPGAIGGSIIGGAFPLLFGQGPGAAAGGAIGGLVGGLAGPGGSFAGSLLGTLLGDIASQGQKIKQLGQDIGFSASQAELLASAFKKTNVDIEKFTSVIQNIRGLGLELEDQARLIQLTTTLTEKYGGQFDKLGTAITSALESGKVNQSTLNQLQSQGINIQQALADKLGVSRDKLLDMAKKGEISLQQLIDTLVDVGNKGAASITRPTSSMDRLSKATKDLGSALGDLGGAIAKSLAPPLNWLADRLTSIIGLAAQGIKTLATLLSGGTAATAAANARARKKLAQEGGPSTGTRYLTVAQTKRLRELEQQEQAKLVTPEKLKPINVSNLGQLPPSSKGGAGKKADKAASDAAREAERVAKALRDTRAQTELLIIQAGLQDRIFSAEQSKNPLLAARLKGEENILAIQSKYAELIANEPNILVQETLIKKGLQEIENARLTTAQSLEAIDASRAESIAELFEAAKYDLVLAQEKNPLKRAELEIERRLSSDAIKKLELTKEQVAELRRILMLTETIKNTDSVHTEIIQDMANAFAGTFAGALNAAADGTKNLGNALADLGQQLAATVAQMLIIYAIGQALGALAGGKNDDSGGILTFLAKAFGYKKAAQGAYWAGGFEAFAAGGVVTKPTMGLVGEGGEPEYIIPASKMSAAMQRYSAGARGSAVIPSSGSTTEGDTSSVSGGTAVAGGIDVRFNVERINSVDYVTADQFQAGIRQAAQQGATQGEQRTLRRLQQSRSTRSRLGLA